MASYILALTGASGAIYGVRLAEELLKNGSEVNVIVSQSAVLILKEELGLDLSGPDPAGALAAFFKKRGAIGTFDYYRNDDLTAPIASGSALKKTMIICPCSMGTLARVASGISGSLIERAADCVIKEGGRLVMVPRETPVSAIHLENMLKLSRLGVTMLPAMPAFYQRPATLDDMVDFVTGKILDSLGVENGLYKRWKSGTE